MPPNRSSRKSQRDLNSFKIQTDTYRLHTITRPPRLLTLMVNPRMSEDQRPTDPTSLSLSGEDPTSVVVPKAARVPQPDPNSYQDYILSTLLEQVGMLKAEREAQDWEGMLAKQTANLSSLMSVNYDLIHEQVRGLVHSMDSVVIRVGQVETHVQDGAHRFDRIDADIIAMKVQMLALESEVTRLKTAASDTH